MCQKLNRPEFSPGFSKAEKITSKKTIEKIYNSGQRIYGPAFSLMWLNNKSDRNIKLLIVVPKKNIKQAVRRNYIKRIIRESYITNKSSIYKMIKKPVQIILTYTKSSALNFNELKSELLTLFKHLEKEWGESTK